MLALELGSTKLTSGSGGGAKFQSILFILIIFSILALLNLATRSLFKMIGGEPKLVLSEIQKVADGNLTRAFSDKAPSGSIHSSVQRMSMSVAELADNLDASTRQLNSELTNFNSRFGSLIDLAEFQQESTEMIAAAVTELSASADNVSLSASENAANTDKADSLSRQTSTLIKGAVGEIEGLETELTAASVAVQALDGEVNSIVSVLDVIRDIAEQTNLLALNAAIEAARAGEQGRGFAVVADEVRNLASRTQDSTKEIHAMISKLQEGSRNAIETMDVCANASKGTVSQSRMAADALVSVVNELKNISDMSSQIASAASEQTLASSDISRRVNLIEESGLELASVVEMNKESNGHLMKLSVALESWVKRLDVR